MTEHDIKDTEHSLESVMKGASKQLERERMAEEKKAKKQMIVGGIVKLILLIAVIGGTVAGYMYREEISEYMEEKKEAREEANAIKKAEKEATSTTGRVKQSLSVAQDAATARDSILDDIHEKGMKK